MKKLSLLIAVLLLLALLINHFSDKAIYHPIKEVAPLPANFEEICFDNASAQKLCAAYKPAPKGRPTILLFHGNSGNISYYNTFARLYSHYGYGVFMFDYRGFGKSEGKLNQDNFFEDARSALDFLITKKNIAPNDIILFAHSLGNAALIEAALAYNDLPFKAVIMQSPFTNTPDMAASFFMGEPYKHDSFYRKALSAAFRPLLANKLFDNISKISGLKHPVFMLYSRQDMLIPWQMSDALFKKAPRGSINFISPYGGHNDFEWGVDAVNEYIQSLP